MKWWYHFSQPMFPQLFHILVPLTEKYAIIFWIIKIILLGKSSDVNLLYLAYLWIYLVMFEPNFKNLTNYDEFVDHLHLIGIVKSSVIPLCSPEENIYLSHLASHGNIAHCNLLNNLLSRAELYWVWLRKTPLYTHQMGRENDNSKHNRYL